MPFQVMSEFRYISVLPWGPYYTQSGTFCKNNNRKVHSQSKISYKGVISNNIMAMDNQRNARPRPSRFKIEIPGDDTKRAELLQKMQNVRQQLTSAFGQAVNNGDILNTVLDFWIKDHNQNMLDLSVPASYSEVYKNDTTQDLFVTTSSSLKTLLDIAQCHARLCSNELKITKTVRRGHVIITTAKCTKSDNAHTYTWSSLHHPICQIKST